MKALTLTTLLGFSALLAACGQKTPSEEIGGANSTPSSAAGMAADMSEGMGKMNMSPEAKMAKGTGKVTAIDKAAGAITLDHGPIAEANWPAMIMAFKAAPALMQSVKVGDEVNFELKLEGGTGEITSITKK